MDALPSEAETNSPYAASEKASCPLLDSTFFGSADYSGGNVPRGGFVTNDLQSDPRLDPRIKALLSMFPELKVLDAESREEMVAEAASPEGLERMEAMAGFFDMCDSEEVAPSKGLRFSTEDIVSSPDGNTIKLQFIRPDNDETLACVYYIHGGGWLRCRVSTATIGPGAGSLRQRAWPW